MLTIATHSYPNCYNLLSIYMDSWWKLAVRNSKERKILAVRNLKKRRYYWLQKKTKILAVRKSERLKKKKLDVTKFEKKTIHVRKSRKQN